MKILVTGADGFIGSHLCDILLKENHEIIAVSRNFKKLNDSMYNNEKIQLNQIDVTDFSNLSKIISTNKPEIIIHLAGETSHKQSFENPMYDVDVNAKSTLCILETIKKSGLNCKFILGSTFIVVGKPETLPVNELTKCNPSTIYGINRLTSEHYCNVYHNVYDIDAISFRLTNVFGPREQYLTPSKNALNYLIYQAYKKNDVTIYNEGKFFRDVIFITDAISAIQTIMKKGKPGNLYWISSGKKTWFYEIAEWLKELIDAKIKYVESPTYTKKVDVGNFVVDNSKLQLLGWNPKISVKDGLKETLDYFKFHSL
jgi:nucleoside-diphosphate-sugar epimerase